MDTNTRTLYVLVEVADGANPQLVANGIAGFDEVVAAQPAFDDGFGRIVTFQFTPDRFNPTGPGTYTDPDDCPSVRAALGYRVPCALGKGHDGEHVYDETRRYATLPYEAR